jgi:MYXO-CTERM domain-containing protein
MRRLSWLRASVLGLSLIGGVALADVAPPPDGGKPADMATTMAHPDMSAATSDDSGCSMSAHGTPATAVGFALVGAALLMRRRRTA